MMDLHTRILYEMLPDVVSELETRTGSNLNAVLNHKSGIAWIVYHKNKKLPLDTELYKKHTENFARMFWGSGEIRIHYQSWEEAYSLSDYRYICTTVDAHHANFFTNLCDTLELIVKQHLANGHRRGIKQTFGSRYFQDTADFVLVPT